MRPPFGLVECVGNADVMVRAQLEQTLSVFIHFPSAIVSKWVGLESWSSPTLALKSPNKNRCSEWGGALKSIQQEQMFRVGGALKSPNKNKCSEWGGALKSPNKNKCSEWGVH